MRIALLVNRDVESNLALNLLLPALRGQAVAVFLSDRVGGAQTNIARLLGQLAWVEQGLFNDVVFPLAESRGSVAGRLATFAEIETRFGIPVRTLATVRSPSALDALRAADADLFVSIRFGKIFGADAIAVPRRGVINLHSGLLPDYRGILATFRALLNGDEEIGCTLHWIDSPAIDDGPIIATARLGVDRDRSLLWHILALYPLGGRLVLDAIGRIGREEPVETEGPATSTGAYYTFPTDEDLVRFTAQGWRLFDREDIHGLLQQYGCA